MDREQIFQLWGRVLKKDRAATDEFVKEYLRQWPKNAFLTEQRTPVNLHMMYLHLSGFKPHPGKWGRE